MKRQLKDSTETYKETIIGKCICGLPVLKTLGSNCTIHSNGDRYHYPEDNTASCIYRCKKCNKTIHKVFRSDKK